MGFIGIPYKIKPGDTLWDLAATYLGDANKFPDIFEFNNRTEVVAAGARRIDNADLIYAGSILRLPIVQSAVVPIAKPPHAPLGTMQRQHSVNGRRPPRLRDEIPRIFMPYSSAYELKNELMVFDFGTYIARVRMVGRILVTLGHALPLTWVANGNFEATAKSRSDNAFTSMMSETKVGYDPTSGHIKFSNKMITSATNILGPSYGVGVELSSATDVPVLKTEIFYPELKGSIGQDSYVASKLKVEIEIEPRMLKSPRKGPDRKPTGMPVPKSNPVWRPRSEAAPNTEPESDWWDTIKGASVGVLVVATVVTVAYGASVVLSSGGSSLAAPAYASAMGVLLASSTAVSISVRTANDQTVN